MGFHQKLGYSEWELTGNLASNPQSTGTLVPQRTRSFCTSFAMEQNEPTRGCLCAEVMQESGYFHSGKVIPFPSLKWSEVAQSCLTLRPHGLQPPRLLCQWDFPGKSTGVGCHHLLRYTCIHAYLCVKLCTQHGGREPDSLCAGLMLSFRKQLENPIQFSPLPLREFSLQ